MAQRAAKDEADRNLLLPAPAAPRVLKRGIKIGRPGYRVVRQRDPETGQRSLLFEVSADAHGRLQCSAPPTHSHPCPARRARPPRPDPVP